MTSPAERTAAIEIAAKLVRRGGKTSVQGANTIMDLFKKNEAQSAEIERLRAALIQTVEFWYDDMPNPSREAISLHDVVNTALKPNAGG